MTLPFSMAVLALAASLQAGVTLLGALESQAFWLAFGLAAAISIAVIEHVYLEMAALLGDGG